ncbi:alkaline phosphatase D family protein [Sphingomonas sp. MMS24-J13]|uniref:alkaline phosphatase D family protein n=1 Tax=Sphingomonas sp. MMS24-J13 TaxID=3238686 RepID=UPI00384DB0CD
MSIDRRSLLGLIGAGAALPAAAAERAATGVAFKHGVASGDPAIDGAILWTRATPIAPAHVAPIALMWKVALEPNGKPVAIGAIDARAAKDFTAKVDVTGLKPGTEYHYWFEAADGTRSPIGRFRTLPTGRLAEAKLAFVTCQNYPSGLFNAYDAIAKLDRVDAIVHLGDYIYEYGQEGYGGATGVKIERLVDPPHEIVTLDDYRRRHALYKTDADLQAAHARAAFICVWDDHEVANDSWTGGAENHQPETEGEWRTRKNAALQAYFEWMPIRDPIPGKPWESINRGFQFGDLATLLMVETRLLARSHQAVLGGRPATPETLAAMLAERNRPDREMLGEPQRHWLEQELRRSVAGGTPWQVLGNQVVMARVAGPRLDLAIGEAQAAKLVASLPPEIGKQVTAALASFKAGLPYDLDAWDGYPAARERLYAAFREAGAHPIVVSGDSHAFWANDLFDDGGRLVASEFGTSSITSPSDEDELGGIPLGKMLREANKEVVYCNQKAKGYILLTLTREIAKAELIAVSTILAKPYEASTIATYEVAPGKARETLRRA